MTSKSIASLAFVFLVACAVYGWAGGGGVPLPERNPHRAHGTAAKAPVLPGDQPTIQWTDEQISDAKAVCAKALADLEIDYQPLPPLKHGLCGAPAPILVKSIGSDPKVVMDPPATMTCMLGAKLSSWLSKTVQPEAKAVLSTQVVKLRNAQSYACRNRYNGTSTPLSEHALANALDVSEFVFASGEHITVLESWPRLVTTPPPPRANPNRAVVAAASIKAAPKTRPASREPFEVVKVRLAEAKINPFVAPTTVVDAKTNPFVVPTADTEPALPVAPPEAPASEATAPEEPSGPAARSKFVRMVHDDACRTFGTVLGPEANEAHKNHFHLDAKVRRHAAVCE
jgi:hypothetical protein